MVEGAPLSPSLLPPSLSSRPPIKARNASVFLKEVGSLWGRDKAGFEAPKQMLPISLEW